MSMIDNDHMKPSPLSSPLKGEGGVRVGAVIASNLCHSVFNTESRFLEYWTPACAGVTEKMGLLRRCVPRNDK